ncbi:phospholipid-transporting ATPase ABCA3-like [Physella acuta]|uniref:phospholipid-transporting ATPase ABCA3-like n=1 Tax=Physella acuta TaxID=109671 RepID=UPI0027DEA91E|nr:phospholipid-transporting ATPase ABCA3-like [Physella acuta]
MYFLYIKSISRELALEAISYGSEEVCATRRTMGVAYAPSCSGTDEFVRMLSTKNRDEEKENGPSNTDSIFGFTTEDDALKFQADNPLLISLILSFPDLSQSDCVIKRNTRVIFREPQSFLPVKLDNLYSNPDPTALGQMNDSDEQSFYSLYRTTHFMQMKLAEAFIRYWGGKALPNDTNIFTKRLPSLPHEREVFGKFLKNLSVFFLVMFMMSIVINTGDLIIEKNTHIKIAMVQVGLDLTAHKISWFLTFFLKYLTPIVLTSTLMCMPLVTRPVLTQTEVTLLIAFLMAYALAMMSFSYLVSACVNKTSFEAVTSGIVFVLFYLPWYTINMVGVAYMSYGTLMFWCLFFNTAMAVGANVIYLHETHMKPLSWSTASSHGDNLVTVNLLEATLMLLLDASVYSLLAMYIEQVNPGELGIPKPYLFFLQSSLWTKSESKTYGEANTPETDAKFEAEPANLQMGIQVNNINKSYGENKVLANVSLNIYEDQITVILGHNGAGKTTLFNILTGVTRPCSGTAVLRGYDIGTKVYRVRKFLGVCLQHNVLFDNLTVWEHMYLYANLKGGDVVEQELNELMKKASLDDKSDKVVSTLASGHKRKLSIALALVGGSEVIVLDEPTTSIDPHSRRQIWDLLRAYKTGRTVLLSTQNMEEADAIGDRIAIMAKGSFKCCGSPMFLKKTYGAGYHLIVVKTPTFNPPALQELMKSYTGTAQLQADLQNEMSYLLPEEEKSQFPELLQLLHTHRQELGYAGLGITATTMEEVFLNVGSEESHELETGENVDQDVDVDGNKHFPPFDLCSGSSLFMSRVKAVLYKKILYSCRTKKLTFLQLFLPVLLAAFPMTAEITKPSGGALTFDLSIYGETVVPVSTLTLNQQNADLVDVYFKQLTGKHEKLILAANNEKQFDELMLKKAMELGFYFYNRKVVIGLLVQNSTDGFRLTALYNSLTSHASPISVNHAMNTLVQHSLGQTFSLQTGYQPITTQDANKSLNDEGIKLLAINLFILLGYSFTMGLFVYFPIHENQSGSRKLQFLFGLNFLSYWIPTLLWDYMLYLTSVLLLLLLLWVYGLKVYTEDDHLLIVAQVFAAFGWALFPTIYIVQNYFNKSTAGSLLVMAFVFFPGFYVVYKVLSMNVNPYSIPGFYVIYKVLSMNVNPYPTAGFYVINKLLSMNVNPYSIPGFYVIYKVLSMNVNPYSIPGLYVIYKVLSMNGFNSQEDLGGDWVVPCPGYHLMLSMLSLYKNFLLSQTCFDVTCAAGTAATRFCCTRKCDDSQGFCNAFVPDYMSLYQPAIGEFVISMVLQGNCEMSSNAYDWRQYESPDVAMEKKRINTEGLEKTDALVLMNLTKRFGERIAVDHICCGVSQRECFGLLGINDAGKTVTMEMIVGHVPISGGTVIYNGIDLRNDFDNLRDTIGYCPQADPLIEELTARETLTMFSRIRGIRTEYLAGHVNHLIDMFLLQPYADKLVRVYSGGTKRKLSVAVALVGNPKLILLDEPSRGVDPKSRRHLWNILSEVRTAGATVLLSTHSMEECDTLCTRLAIMIKGKFQCIGSSQDLKNKFGKSYSLTIQLAKLDNGSFGPVPPVVEFLEQRLPGIELVDEHQGYVYFRFPTDEVALYSVFAVLEAAKFASLISDYSMHQTTLEQVFLSLARKFADEKNADVDIEQSLCERCI